MLIRFLDTYATTYQPYKKGNWCYEDGCIYRGLAEMHSATGEARWLAHLTRLVDARIEPDGSLSGYEPSEYNIDNIMAGRGLLYLYNVTGKDRYITAAGALMTQLATHPRTKCGVYWHKLRYPWQIWLDGLYMGLPFQIGYAQATGQDGMISDALQQLSIALDKTYVPETGLYAHAFDESGLQPWANDETGLSMAHWARAIGWLAMACVDIFELVGVDKFAPLQRRVQALFLRLQELRQPDGVWLQVIDQPDLAGNYEEMSASAMFVYALAKARRLGLLDDLTPTTADLVNTLTNRCVREDIATGAVEMVEICEVAGLGSFGERYRDGSAAYYLSEPRVPNDAKGVGPLFQCVSEAILDDGLPLAKVAT